MYEENNWESAMTRVKGPGLRTFMIHPGRLKVGNKRGRCSMEPRRFVRKGTEAVCVAAAGWVTRD